jgi:nuclear transcription factor Y alpha
MQSKSENANRLDPGSHAIPQAGVYSEPWWRIGYNPMSPVMTGGNVSNSSSLECPNGVSDSNDGQSPSNGGLNEDDDDATKESQNTSSRSGASNGYTRYFKHRICINVCYKQTTYYDFWTDL